MMETWLLELVKQGGLAAVAALSLFLLNRSYNDRLAAEKKNTDERIADERKATEEIRLMWEATMRTIAESNRLISAFMERFQVQQSQPIKKRRVSSRVVDPESHET